MNYHTATFPQFQKSVTRSYLPFANQEYFGRNMLAIGHRRYLHEQRVPFRLHCHGISNVEYFHFKRNRCIHCLEGSAFLNVEVDEQ